MKTFSKNRFRIKKGCRYTIEITYNAGSCERTTSGITTIKEAFDFADRRISVPKTMTIKGLENFQYAEYQVFNEGNSFKRIY